MSEYTVKQMATELSVSKPTVQKVINDLQIVPSRIVNNKYRIYAAADLERIAEVLRMKTLQKDTAKPQNDTEKLKSETENEIAKPKTDCENTAKPQSDTEKLKNTDGMSEVKALYLVIDTLQKQIEELKADKEASRQQLQMKDNQIEAYIRQLDTKDQQISDYTKRLSEAHYVMALERHEKEQPEQRTQDDEDPKEQKQPGNEVVSEVVESTVDQQPEDPDQVAAAAAEDHGRTEESVKVRWWMRLFHKE